MKNRKKTNDQPYADNITNIGDINSVENIDENKKKYKDNTTSTTKVFCVAKCYIESSM